MKTSTIAGTLVVLLACGRAGNDPSAQQAEACARIAVEYRAALDEAVVCDPSAVAPCGDSGASVAVLQESTGAQTIDGLCLGCSPGPAVRVASRPTLDAIIARYTAAGCRGTCPCPMAPPGVVLTPACVSAGATGRCDWHAR